MSYVDRLAAPGPKKLLALDGGGIRGVLTLEVLARLEAMLGEEHGATDGFVLADYFDYIGGTSTGAVIAAGLATGRPVGDLLDLYTERGDEIFDKASLLGATDVAVPGVHKPVSEGGLEPPRPIKGTSTSS